MLTNSNSHIVIYRNRSTCNTNGDHNDYLVRKSQASLPSKSLHAYWDLSDNQLEINGMIPADNWDTKGKTLDNVPTVSINFTAKLQNIKVTIYGLQLHFIEA